ncbi:MAG: amidase [Pseudomonadota bacterium]|nr:amidase [Pseudomonadota bacterium]
MDLLLDGGAVPLAAAIRRRELGCEDVVRATLDRITRLDPTLSAFVDVYGASALRDARAKDAAKKGATTPFHGVPIGIKDMNFVRFGTTRFGSRAIPGVWSPFDDRTVARLRAAGFVIVGKMAMSELGVVPITEPVGRPPTRNPWDPSRTPGGSSGGSAAAVASGMLPVAHGSDGGGSIRIPASFCGLVGLKASRGRVANPLGVKDPGIIYTCGALTRTVEDASAMLDVLGGPGAPAKTGPLRVRVVLDVPMVATDPYIRAAVEAAAARLADAGHILSYAEAPKGDVDDFLPIWQRLFGALPFVPWHKAEPVTRWLAEAGRTMDPRFAVARQAELTARWGGWLDGCDVLLTPTVSVAAPPVGSFQGEDGEAVFRAVAMLGVWTAPFNVTGQPAVSVPVGLHPLGTPIGAQLAGPMGREATLLALAAVAEVRPGARPRVHATG